MEEFVIREFYEREFCVRLHTGLVFFQCWRILVSCLVAPVVGFATRRFRLVSQRVVDPFQPSVTPCLLLRCGVFNDVVTYTVESGYHWP